MFNFLKLKVVSGSQNGFTLLEMVIVLVLLGMITGLAFPQLNKMYTAMSMSTQDSDLLDEIKDLGYKAFVNGKEVALSAPVSSGNRDQSQNARIQGVHPEFKQEEGWTFTLTIPEGLVIIVDKPILYHSNGICSGGEIQIINNGKASRYLLDPPYCVPKIVDVEN
jgi:general secretion pathway protein G